MRQCVPTRLPEKKMDGRMLNRCMHVGLGKCGEERATRKYEYAAYYIRGNSFILTLSELLLFLELRMRGGLYVSTYRPRYRDIFSLTYY